MKEYMNEKVLNNEIEDVVDDIPFVEEKFDEETLQDMKDAKEGNITSPLKAIKLFCIDCCGGSFQEVKKCPCKKCPLYNFRVGKKMAVERKKKEMSEERREMLRRNVAKAQAAKKAKRKMNKG